VNDKGYLIQNSVFLPAECDTLIEILSSVALHRSRAGVRNLMSVQAIGEVAIDSRLTGFTRQLTGKSLHPYKATLFEKAGNANWLVSWHQDTALPLIKFYERQEWGPWSRKAGIDYAHAPSWALERIVAIRIQLDESNADNGPLRVIEGSHRFGVLADEELENVVPAGCEVSCETDKGGIIAMSPLTVHASSKSVSGNPRRVLHIEYAETLELAPGIRLAVA
jgi:ectoine hydroxylase-related dioxygenase (phytanoyl-CoA dioxygenase family)